METEEDLQELQNLHHELQQHQLKPDARAQLLQVRQRGSQST